MSGTPSSGSSESLAANLAIVAMFWIAGAAWAWFNLAAFPGFHPVERGLVFNEMLTQLLKGRFDISPATIGWEGFVRAGRTYAYFGIFCALLRAPLLIFGDIRTTDITSVSLFVATALSLACRLGAVALVFAGARLDRGFGALRTVVLAAVAFSGESVQFLRPSVYQEVVSWGAALAAGFVLLLAWLVLGRPRRTAMVHAAMAVLAGLALMCRVSFGVGLYAALGLVMAARLWLTVRDGGSWARTVLSRTPAAIVAMVLALLTLAVNYARWGDPLSFVPLQLNTGPNLAYADRLPRLARYGEFNLLRIPFALQYYFAPSLAADATQRRADVPGLPAAPVRGCGAAAGLAIAERSGDLCLRRDGRILGGVPPSPVRQPAGGAGGAGRPGGEPRAHAGGHQPHLPLPDGPLPGPGLRLLARAGGEHRARRGRQAPLRQSAPSGGGGGRGGGHGLAPALPDLAVRAGHRLSPLARRNRLLSGRGLGRRERPAAAQALPLGEAQLMRPGVRALALAVTLAVFAASSLVVLAQMTRVQPLGYDFSILWTGARVVARGHAARLYDFAYVLAEHARLTGDNRVGPLVYPPSMLWVLAPLAPLGLRDRLLAVGRDHSRPGCCRCSGRPC